MLANKPFGLLLFFQLTLNCKFAIQGMKEAHIRDGLALCEYLCYLDKTVPALENGDQAVLTESSGAQMLDGLRSEQDKFVSLSFETITGSGPNGAIIHYSCTPETSRLIAVLGAVLGFSKRGGGAPKRECQLNI